MTEPIIMWRVTLVAVRPELPDTQRIVSGMDLIGALETRLRHRTAAVVLLKTRVRVDLDAKAPTVMGALVNAITDFDSACPSGSPLRIVSVSIDEAAGD